MGIQAFKERGTSLILLLFAIIECQGQSVGDYNAGWNRPTINHSTHNFDYVYFGQADPYDRSPVVDLSTLPPIPGLKYRSYIAFCPKDTCYSSRAVIAVRCPEESVLLQWVSKRAACFTDWCKNGVQIAQDSEKVLSVSSSADICNRYIHRIAGFWGGQPCLEDGDNNCANEQFAFMLTDCWRTDKYCTFYESTWYDWMSCGDTTAESYYSVNLETGEVATITDFVNEEDLPKLANLMVKYLKNYSGEIWSRPAFEWVPSEHLKLLKEMDGCALIREGLVIYYHPYRIACGAEGQYNAIIPYSKLLGILKPDVEYIENQIIKL